MSLACMTNCSITVPREAMGDWLSSVQKLSDNGYYSNRGSSTSPYHLVGSDGVMFQLYMSGC